jgi:S-adenosylmethionine:tRNA ribosyltransferase-isomerase
MATLRIGPATALRVVDAVLTGVHEPSTSHHELLRAFVDDATLRRVDTELMGHGYRAHEFGDSVLIERSRAAEADSSNATGALDRGRLVAIREP